MGRLKPVSGASPLSLVAGLLRFFFFFTTASTPMVPPSPSLPLRIAALLNLAFELLDALILVGVRPCPLRLLRSPLHVPFSSACKALAYDSSSTDCPAAIGLGFLIGLVSGTSDRLRFRLGFGTGPDVFAVIAPVRSSLKISAIWRH